MTQTATTATTNAKVSVKYGEHDFSDILAYVLFSTVKNNDLLFPNHLLTPIVIRDADGNYFCPRTTFMTDVINKDGKKVNALCIGTDPNDDGSLPCTDKTYAVHNVNHLSMILKRSRKSFPLGNKTPITVADLEGNYHFTKMTFQHEKVKVNGVALDALCIVIDRTDNDVI